MFVFDLNLTKMTFILPSSVDYAFSGSTIFGRSQAIINE